MRGAAILFWAALIGVLPARAQTPAVEQHFPALAQRLAVAKAAMMANPAKTLQIAGEVAHDATALPPAPAAKITFATALWLEAEAHIGLNQVEQAAPIVNEALALAVRFAPASKLHGDLLRSRGAIAANGGRVREALASYQRAYAVFGAAHEPRSQAIELQDIGEIYEDAGDFERALGYYSQASEAYSRDPALLLANYNNRAEVLRKLKRGREAEAQYKAALREARLLNSAVLEVRILCNLADLQADQGEISVAQATVDRAAALARSGEAAGWRAGVLGTAAKVALAAHDRPRAVRLYDELFKGVDLTTTDPQYREFHLAASQAYEADGKPQLALAHLRAFQRLDRSVRDLTATMGAQLASARFDFANQNARIVNLKAERLNQQVQLERQHARVRLIITVALLILALGVLGFLSFAQVTGRRSRNRLRRINAELERALRAKTEFLAMTSHEIRTPLNGILGMTQVLLAEHALAPGMRDRLRLVHGAGETMKALVDDILDVAKMEAGAIEIVEEDADLGEMLDGLAALWADQARAKGVDLSCDHVGLPPRLRFDPGRLRQIVFNILSNAVKFTATGEVALTARAENVGGRDMLSITVRDSGIGIDRSMHEQVFEPFQQADASTTRKFGGTGLGLAISRKLARAMGGDITLTSEVGTGSIFVVRLPLKLAQAPGAVPTRREPASDLGAAQLLLVEANLVTQGMLGAVLECEVAGLTCAASGNEALALLATTPVDHVLIDAGSATIDGLNAPDALRRLLAAAAAAGSHASVLVGAGAAMSLDEVTAMGNSQIIQKPIGAKALVRRLDELYAPPPSASIAA